VENINITQLDSINNGGDAQGLYVQGNYAYLANGNAGLWVYDISNPADIQNVDSIDNGGNAQGLYAQGNYAYLANGHAGLWVYEANNALKVDGNLTVNESITTGDIFADNMDIGGALKIKEETVATKSYVDSKRYAYFGGMYGEPSAAYTNPLANDTKACPAGYKKFKIFGTINVDHQVTLCLGVPGQVAKVAEFGGIYSTQWNNPFTGNKTCPSGFNSQTILGTINLDNGMVFCYSTASNNNKATFGGIFSTYYNNPITISKNCYFEHEGIQVYGTLNLDNGIKICY